MKKLLNTLYITNEKAYLKLENENIVIAVDGKTTGKVPLINIESIVYFGYPGASAQLLGFLAEQNIPISFLSPTGQFYVHINNEYHGNIILRKKQYLLSEQEKSSIQTSRNMIFGKVANQKFVLEKFSRDYKNRFDMDDINKTVDTLKENLDKILSCENFEILRGLEGYCASVYFGQLDKLIIKNKDEFYFKERSKRPPLDNFNAVISFLYTLLAHDCASALETVGLDPYCGFMHADVPGRISLALDLMEEMRPVMVDKFVIGLINKQALNKKDFKKKENGAIYFTDDGKKKIINYWQERKQEEIQHPFLDEKIKYGLIPYTQALLLSRTLRNEIEEYPPFLWR